MSHGVSQFLSVDLHKHTTQLGSREERIVCFTTQRDTGSDSQQIFPSMARARKTNSYSLLRHYNSKHLILRYLVPYCSEMQVTITQWETVGNGHAAHIGLCRCYCLFNFNVCLILLSVRFYCLFYFNICLVLLSVQFQCLFDFIVCTVHHLSYQSPFLYMLFKCGFLEYLFLFVFCCCQFVILNFI